MKNYNLDVPNIVKEFKVGNTTIRIADNYCRDKTPEDVQRILQRIARNAQAAFTAEEYRRRAEERASAMSGGAAEG